MPKALKRKLKREAEEKGYSEERTNRYVYGTLANRKKRRKK